MNPPQDRGLRVLRVLLEKADAQAQSLCHTLKEMRYVRGGL